MADLQIHVPPDGLTAFLSVAEGSTERYPAPAELAKALWERGVLAGLKDDVLRRMSAERICGRRIVVAEGRGPERGTPGRLEVLVDLSMVGKPRLLPDGSVDHRALSFAVNVKKGVPLLRRIPPQAGIDGLTVWGKAIAAPLPPDVQLPLRPGTERSSLDPDILVAAVEGSVHQGRDGSMEVKTARIIQGDVDYSTGNVEFSGDLQVLGIIRSGFSIDCGGMVTVRGGVEEAHVKALESLRIDGGASGAGTGSLYSGGLLSAHHIENFTVSARGDIVVEESLLHCTVECEGWVRARTIVGGTVSAVGGIEADIIGSHSESRTVVKAGHSLSLVQQHHLLKAKHDSIAEERGQLRSEMYYIVKNGMDDKGLLGEVETEELTRLRGCSAQKRAEMAQIALRMGEIEELLKHLPEPTIKAAKVYGGTVLRFGLTERVVKDTLERVIIHLDGERIAFRKW